MRLEAVVETIRRDFDCEPGAALACRARPTGRHDAAGRARELDRELRLMGPINPLALRSTKRCQERHDFLAAARRREEHTARAAAGIKAVDQEIVTVFDSAFADVQKNFTGLFATLFPGGRARASRTPTTC